jgi:hypothetical protein
MDTHPLPSFVGLPVCIYTISTIFSESDRMNEAYPHRSLYMVGQNMYGNHPSPVNNHSASLPISLFHGELQSPGLSPLSSCNKKSGTRSHVHIVVSLVFSFLFFPPDRAVQTEIPRRYKMLSRVRVFDSFLPFRRPFPFQLPVPPCLEPLPPTQNKVIHMKHCARLCTNNNLCEVIYTGKMHKTRPRNEVRSPQCKPDSWSLRSLLNFSGMLVQ